MRLFEGGWRRGAFAAVGLGLALCRAEAVFASTFSVSPVQVNLSPGSPSALLTVGNDSQETLRFQVSAFAWDQDTHGRIVLSPTRDVVFFPMMLTLAPGERRRIRVGSTAPIAAIEKTYRIFVEELPSAPGPADESAGTQIRVLTKLGIPVFVQPKEPKPETTVEIQGVSGDRIHFVVRNTGNAHLLLQDLRIHGTGSAGADVLDRTVQGWYLLAGRAWEFEQPLTAEECAGLTSLSIDAETERGVSTARLELPLPACDESSARTALLLPK